MKVSKVKIVGKFEYLGYKLVTIKSGLINKSEVFFYVESGKRIFVTADEFKRHYVPV